MKIAVTGARTAVTIAVTAEMTGVTGVADPGCCADSPKRQIMGTQHPDIPVLHGLSDGDPDRRFMSMLITVEFNVVLDRIRCPRDVMGSVT